MYGLSYLVIYSHLLAGLNLKLWSKLLYSIVLIAERQKMLFTICYYFSSNFPIYHMVPCMCVIFYEDHNENKFLHFLCYPYIFMLFVDLCHVMFVQMHFNINKSNQTQIILD